MPHQWYLNVTSLYKVEGLEFSVKLKATTKTRLTASRYEEPYFTFNPLWVYFARTIPLALNLIMKA